MAKQQEDEKKLDKFLGASQSLASGKRSAAQKLWDVNRSLDPSNMKAVKEFRDEMPDTVKTFVGFFQAVEAQKSVCQDNKT